MGNTVMNRKKIALKASASHFPATPRFVVTQCTSVLKEHMCAYALTAYTDKTLLRRHPQQERGTVTMDHGHKHHLRKVSQASKTLLQN